MPLPKPYPPSEIDYEDWNDLADNYAGKCATLIVDVNGKGDYSTIQEAINALPSTNAGEILIKGGEYLLSKAIKIDGREDLVLRGVGKATRLKVANKVGCSIVQDAAAGQKNVVASNGGIFQVGQHVCIKDNTNYMVNVIAQINGNTLTMEDELEETYYAANGGWIYTCQSAIYVTGPSKRIRITNLLVDGNRANQEFGRTGYYPKEHQGDGMRVSSTCESILVDHCWVKSAIAHGICLGGKGHLVVSNECWDNGYDGINAEPSCDEVLIQGNYCHDQEPTNGWNGIQVGYSTYATGTISVIGNVCDDNRQGIAAQGGSRVHIAGNQLKNNREDGIEIYSMDRFVISGNLITGADDLSDMTNTAIHVEAASSVGVISGNVVELCAGIGIYCEEGAYVSVVGNTVRKVAKHGIKIASNLTANGRDCTITGNTIIAADNDDTETYDGIAVCGDRCVVSGNRLDDCDRYAINIDPTADKTLVIGNQCTIYTGTSVGARSTTRAQTPWSSTTS